MTVPSSRPGTKVASYLSAMPPTQRVPYALFPHHHHPTTLTGTLLIAPRPRRQPRHGRRSPPHRAARKVQPLRRAAVHRHAVPGVQKELLLETAPPPLRSVVYPIRLTCMRIKRFFWECGVFLTIICNHQQRWESGDDVSNTARQGWGLMD